MNNAIFLGNANFSYRKDLSIGDYEELFKFVGVDCRYWKDDREEYVYVGDNCIIQRYENGDLWLRKRE